MTLVSVIWNTILTAQKIVGSTFLTNRTPREMTEWFWCSHNGSALRGDLGENSEWTTEKWAEKLRWRGSSRPCAERGKGTVSTLETNSSMKQTGLFVFKITIPAKKHLSKPQFSFSSIYKMGFVMIPFLQIFCDVELEDWMCLCTHSCTWVSKCRYTLTCAHA